MSKRYLKLMPISYEVKKDMLNMIDLIHLNGETLLNHKRLLKLIYEKYKDATLLNKDFIDFYNRILGKLVDFFHATNSRDSIFELKDEYFLSVNNITHKTQWEQANKIFYIDDKPNYEILPQSIREKVQPHFTNRDKNTFGKIAGKIGNRFSNSIQKELLDTKILETNTSIAYFPYLSESIAILESMLERRLDEYFEIIRHIHVFVCEEIHVKISVSNLDTINIPVEHYIDIDANFNIYISEGIEDVNRIAETINELFVSLLGRDLQRFRPDLVRFLNTFEKIDYLRDYDIVETRIAEIKNSLETTERTQKQRFWEAILNARTISERKKIFIEKDIDFEELSKVLEINIELIHYLDASFNYEKMSETSNINILVRLFKELSLTLEELNSNLFPQIDFRTMYERKLLQIKNKFEHRFNAKLYEYLLDKDIDEQSKYLETLDQYNHSFEISVQHNTLELDINNYFLSMLKRHFKFINFSSDDLEEKHNDFNSISIYTKYFELLKERLLGIEYTEDSLEEYLSTNEIRSLLYFDNVEKISSDFIYWYKANIEDETSDKNLEDELNELVDVVPSGIQVISTSATGRSLVFGGSNGGRAKTRIDGGSSNENKKRIGLIAELVAFNELQIDYVQVKWVSKYASEIYKTHPGYNPEGTDGLGYDIECFDSEGNKYCMEVKGKADNSDVFDISKNEIDKAIEEQEYYKIIFVKNVMDKEKRKVFDLGNLFMFENHETFFSNQKFTINYKNFEIHFQEKLF